MDREQSKYGTNFTESELLPAMTVEDYDHVRALISEMTAREKFRLAVSCEQLTVMLRRSAQAQGRL